MVQQDQSISERSREFKEILQRWTSFYDFYTLRLVYHLYSKGYTCQAVADILDVSKQFVQQKYPKKNHE